MRRLIKRWWIWLGLAGLAVILLAYLVVASTRPSPEREAIAAFMDRMEICTEPRFARSKRILVVKSTPIASPQSPLSGVPETFS